MNILIGFDKNTTYAHQIIGDDFVTLKTNLHIFSKIGLIGRIFLENNILHDVILHKDYMNLGIVSSFLYAYLNSHKIPIRNDSDYRFENLKKFNMLKDNMIFPDYESFENIEISDYGFLPKEIFNLECFREKGFMLDGI